MTIEEVLQRHNMSSKQEETKKPAQPWMVQLRQLGFLYRQTKHEPACWKYNTLRIDWPQNENKWTKMEIQSLLWNIDTLYRGVSKDLIGKLTFPKASPHTTTSPLLRVPFCTIRVATDPLDLSRPASITVPFAFLWGLAFNSCNFTDFNKYMLESFWSQMKQKL